MVGALGTLVGAGGGFVLVPVLLFLYPERDPGTVTAMSLIFVLLNAMSGSTAYLRQGRIDLRTAGWFAGGTLPGAVAGVLVVGLVPRRTFEAVFALTLILLALYLLFRRESTAIREPASGRGVVHRRFRDRCGNTFSYSFQLWKGVILSTLIGFLGALLGIGGGIMGVPMMTLVLHVPVHIAVATSQAVVAIMAGQSTLTHLATGTFGWDRALFEAMLLSVGALPGAQLGARLGRRFGGGAITRVLATSLLLVGIRLGLRAVGI